MPDTVRLVALLRGINVGRGNRIAMADLRALVQRLGFADVATHLQSGNVVFSSAGGAAIAAAGIEQALAGELGLNVKVIVRSHAELASAVAANPLCEVATDPSKHLVGFLSGDPDPDGVHSLAALDAAPDQLCFTGRELYLWCPAGISVSPFFKVAWDKVLGVSVTMRNWTTVTKLLELSGTARSAVK